MQIQIDRPIPNDRHFGHLAYVIGDRQARHPLTVLKVELHYGLITREQINLEFSDALVIQTAGLRETRINDRHLLAFSAGTNDHELGTPALHWDRIDLRC